MYGKPTVVELWVIFVSFYIFHISFIEHVIRIKSVLKIMLKFSKFAGYNINTQKEVVFLYTNNEQF